MIFTQFNWFRICAIDSTLDAFKKSIYLFVNFFLLCVCIFNDFEWDSHSALDSNSHQSNEKVDLLIEFNALYIYVVCYAYGCLYWGSSKYDVTLELLLFIHSVSSLIEIYWNQFDGHFQFRNWSLITDHENIWIYCYYVRRSIHEKYIKSNQKYVLVASPCQKSINWSKMIRVLSSSFFFLKNKT